MSDHLKIANRIWAEIDLAQVATNFRIIRANLNGKPKILVVVKADAYGHGAVPVARKVVAEGADMLGVGDSHEALELRFAGIRVPILILGAIIEGEIENVVRYDIIPCIHSTQRMEQLQDEAARQGKTVKVHLMVDTGMGRLGVSLPKALELVRKIHLCSNLELDGICTHLSSVYGQGDEDRDFTRSQMERFHEMVAALNGAASGRNLLFHVQNSGALYQKGEDPLFNMVRPGAAIYGLGPQAGALRHLGIRPVLSLRTQIIFFKDVPAGTPISYDRSYVTRHASRIATLPVGYNDGFRYHLSNRAQVLVRGSFAPVVGKVTMDYTMVDVTEIPGVELGDVVTLVGADGDRAIEVPDLAQMLNTVPFEITCGLGRRVRRIFRDGNEAVPEMHRFLHLQGSTPAFV